MSARLLPLWPPPPTAAAKCCCKKLLLPLLLLLLLLLLLCFTDPPLPVVGSPLLPWLRSRLQHNQLSGTLPGSWATSLPNLQILSLHQNQLRGTMPLEWLEPGAFQKLEEMYIQNNQVGADGGLGCKRQGLQAQQVCCCAGGARKPG